MDGFIAAYSALATGIVSAVQRVGILSFPIVIAIAVIVNFFGGERAIRAVVVAVATTAILLLILTNTVAISNWVNSGFPATGAGTTVIAGTPVPAA